MKKITIIYLFSCLMVLSACTTYEEGPAFTLATATKRINADWQIKNIFVNGVANTSVTGNIIFNEDNTYTTTGIPDNYFGKTGEWSFVSEKEELLMIFHIDTLKFMKYYEIEKLTADELVIELDESTEKIRIEGITK